MLSLVILHKYTCIYLSILPIVFSYTRVYNISINKQRTAPQIAGSAASDRTVGTSQGRRKKRRENKTMTNSFKAMAERMAQKAKMVRIFADRYENKRNCPFYSELVGMEQALKTMGIEYSFEYNEEYMMTAVTVMGQRVEVE